MRRGMNESCGSLQKKLRKFKKHFLTLLMSTETNDSSSLTLEFLSKENYGTKMILTLKK